MRRDPVERGRAALAEEPEFHHYCMVVTNDEQRTADELERWQRAKADVEKTASRRPSSGSARQHASRIFNAN